MTKITCITNDVVSVSSILLDVMYIEFCKFCSYISHYGNMFLYICIS